MFVICDWRNENAEGIYEMSHCFVACFTIFTGPAFTFSIHWARCWCQEPHTAHTHTHSSILCTYRGQNVIQAAHPSVIPPHGGRCTDCKYHSHTQLHVSKKHTSDKPPSIIPHLQQTTSPFPWQHDCCGVPATGVPERQVTAGSDSHSWVRLRNITRCE